MIGGLLLSCALTCAAGLFGLHRLDASLEGAVSVDVPRLMTITDVRRQIRTMVVAEGNFLLETNPASAAKIAADIQKANASLASLFGKYATLVLPEDQADLDRLRADVTGWTAIDDRVRALATAGRTADATALAKTHSKAWEDLIKGLISHADAHFARSTAEAREVSGTARVLLIGVFAGSALLGLILGVLIYRAIRRMVGEVVRLKDELIVANEGLERTVDERTRTIRAILDHVSFGFFLVDRELRITEGHTRSLAQLLGRDDLAGQPVAGCLGLDGAAAADFDANVTQIFDDFLPEELSCDQVPGRIVRAGRVLRVQASAVRDAQGAVAQILFGISDVTDLEAAERTNRESQTLLRALKNPDPFRRFVADLTERFGSVREAVQKTDEARARRELHTIKGNVGCYGLTDLARQAHAIEDKPTIDLPPVLDLEHEFSRFLDQHVDLLGITPGEPVREVFRIDGDELTRLEAAVASANDLATLRQVIDTRLQALRWQPASRVLGPLDAQVASLAERLGKDVGLEIWGGDVLVLPAQVMPIIAVLPHMIRNAIDHGIEPAGARGAKPDRARVEVRFEDRHDGWRIMVSDDGRGIDTDKLRAKAIAVGKLHADEPQTHAQLCMLIFAPSLSTADEVSEISGRGEGMAAVAEVVRNQHGTLTVDSERGVGTTITIDLPKPAAVRIAA